jgi:hypothetical protein
MIQLPAIGPMVIPEYREAIMNDMYNVLTNHMISNGAEVRTISKYGTHRSRGFVASDM